MNPRHASQPMVEVLLGLLLLATACSKQGTQGAAPDAFEDNLQQLRHEIRAEPIPITGRLVFDSASVPAGARGKYASFDGDNFLVTMGPRQAAGLTAQQVFDQTVAPLLRAMGYAERLRDFRPPPPQGRLLPSPDLSSLAAETCREVQGERYQRFHPVCRAMTTDSSNPVAERVFNLAYGMTVAQFRADIERQRIEYVFSQQVQNVPIEHTAVIAARWDGETITTVHGAVINRYGVLNAARLSAAQAIDRGQSGLVRLRGLSRTAVRLEKRDAVLVLLPYGSARAADGSQVIGLRYAWRTLLFAWPSGAPTRPGYLLSWMAWIDAQDGRLLVLVPQFDEIGAVGSVWRRDPNTPQQTMGFEVDPASGGQYVLSRAGVFNRIDRLGDGNFDDDEVSISSTTGGSSATFANFNQSPLNDGANALCTAGANNTFRQVNTYAHLHTFRQTLISAGTFPTFPEAAVTVWTDMAGSSNSAGYDAFGSGQSRLRLAIGTGFADATCPDVAGGTLGPPVGTDPSVLSGTNDVTGMTHEFTHLSTKRLMERRPADWCGTPPCTMPDPLGRTLFHDLADAWAEAYASSPCMAGWYRKNSGGIDAAENCATHHEGGFLPRLASIGEPFTTASALDHFPERRALLVDGSVNTGEYPDMQIPTTALWLTRQGMRSKCLPSGTPQYWVRLNRALYNYGFLSSTCVGCDRDIYRYAQNLLQMLAWQWANAGAAGGPPGFAHNGAHSTNKLLSGWARVGLFLVPSPCFDGDATTGDPTFCPVAAGGEMAGDAIVDVFDNDAGDDNVVDGITHPEFDYLQRGSDVPTFRVWTGPRYRFDAAGSASGFVPSAATPALCHTQYQVELSGTDTFASMITSGWQTASATTAPECYGTWNPPVTDWNTLGGAAGDVKVYYRVRTRDAAGMNERLSTLPGNGSFTVPAPYVIVNAAGQP